MPLQALTIQLEAAIQAPPTRVWTALTEETGRWWLPEFYATPRPEHMELEPRPGGRLFERGAEGAGVLWYVVIEIVPPQVLSLSGDLAPPYGGPARSLLRIELEEFRRGTLLKLTDSLFGVVDETAEQTIREGWTRLFGESLKQFVESAERGVARRGPTP